MQTQCKKCVMDRSANEIFFNAQGVCNFCHQAQGELALIEKEKKNLYITVKRVKDAGKNKHYDVLIGLSGGLDSSYLLYRAVKMGLRPLCFSVDNGWNSPKADENIMKLVEGLKVPFYRYTIDMKKFHDLQSAFIKAGLPNIEIPTDHILMAASLEMAQRYGIKYILSGGNVASESIMPPSWGYSARDLVHIKDVYRKMTGRRLDGLPLCSLLKWNIYRWWYGIQTVYLLDYLDYKRQDAIETLSKEFDWKNYGQKHEESVFTSWFQNYYLFEKFSIDKRKAHLSSLINSGQMTREEALSELAYSPVYPKIGIEKKAMQYTRRSHNDFRKDERLYNTIASVIRFCKRIWRF